MGTPNVVEAQKAFYDELKRDLKKEGSDSFLYQYLRKEKKERIAAGLRGGEKRRDVYVLLSLRFRAIRGETDAAGKAAYLKTALTELAQNEKLRQRGKEDSFKLLKELGYAAAGPDVFRGQRSLRAQFETLLELLKTGALRISMDDLERIHEDLLRCCLDLEATTLLQDAERKQNRRKDRMLVMYCEFRSYRQLDKPLPQPAAAAAAPDFPDEEEIRALEAFSERAAGKRGGVLLPVCIDPVCGAALCLLGSANFALDRSLYLEVQRAAHKEGQKHWCCWVCFYPTDWSVSRGGDDGQPEDEISVSWSNYDHEIKDVVYPNLREALSWYRSDILGNGRERALESIRERNGAAPPDCPKRFRAYYERRMM